VSPGPAWRRRIAAELDAGRATLRPCRIEDAGRVWEWRYAGDAAQFYRRGSVPSWEEHLQWIEGALRDPSRLLLILELEGRPLCHLRLDQYSEAPEIAEVGICVAPEARGCGCGRRTLACADQVAVRRGFRKLRAKIHRDNAASLRLFRAAAYHATAEIEDFVLYEKAVQSSTGIAGVEDE
jgi:L-amino acid N-acyltransferase YncA